MEAVIYHSRYEGGFQDDPSNYRPVCFSKNVGEDCIRSVILLFIAHLLRWVLLWEVS